MRYGSATAAVGVALLLQSLLVPLFGAGPDASPFMMFFAAVMVGAYFGGLGPGFLATALSALSAWYFFLSPQYSFQILTLGQGLRLLVFALEGAVISLLVEAMYSAKRRAEASARQSREDRRSLRESEDRFRTLADNISQLAWMADGEGWIFWYNKRWFDYTGTTLEEMQGWGWKKVHHPEHVDRVVERVQRAWDTGEPWEDTFPLRGRDDTYRWFLSRARPIRDEAGRIVCWFGTNTDVTEQRRTEEALRQSEERYRAVIEQSAEGIYLVDADTLRILEANPAFQELLGYAPEELVGTDVRDLIALPREEVDAAVRLTLKVGRRLVGERRYRRKDGTLVYVEVGANVISYGGRRVICAVVRDMTERKRAEEALREVRQAERNRMARDLHDGPLQDLSYAAQAMEILRLVPSGEAPAGVLEGALEALRRSSREVRAAVNDLRREEHDRPFPELLESLTERARAMAPDQSVSLVVNDFPEEPLGRWGGEILSVVQEALTNARRHSGAKNVRVILRAEAEDLVIEVSDDGRGFGPEDAPGVGLSSMRERAAVLGGELELESEVGEGTRVRLRVPRTGSPKKTSEEGRPETAQRAGPSRTAGGTEG